MEPERRQAEGEFTPEGDRQDYPHEQGFAEATRRALRNMDKRAWPGSHRVTVTFSADVSVVNPGQIDTYRATLTED